MDKIKELKKILKTVGAENVWRPVAVKGHKLLAHGIGDAHDGLAVDIPSLNFEGKTVVDLGCNFGYYSFLAKSAGARHVLGLDMDARVIRGCEIIKTLNDVEGVTFCTLDITKTDGIGMFDIGMMVDLIGKEKIRTGVANDFLNALERLSEKEMLLTLRPRYHIEKNIQGDFIGLRKKYPGDYIQDNYFSMVDYVRDRFRSDWEMHIISPKSYPERETKQTLHFVKRRHAIE